MTRKQKKLALRVIAAAVLTLPLLIIRPEGAYRFLFFAPYLIAGIDVLIKAFKGIAAGQPFDENFLMAVASLGAFILGEYSEAVAVMIFYKTGELFQSIAVGKSRKSIAGLMDIRPDHANVENENGELIKTSPSEVPAGSVVTVLPGEKIPIDGVVLSGESTLDLSALTGESAPRDVSPGESVQSGSVNLSGLLKIQTTKEFGESTVSKILELVENASSRKSRSENFISRFARIYTPAVCVSALLLAVCPPLFRLAFLNADPLWREWIYRALTFLVISCPCALVISIPLSFFGGIAGAGRAGVLVKGSNYLEGLSRVKYMLFDKTGTVTYGVFEVVGIHHNAIEKEKVLETAALAEAYSNHPISASIRKACKSPQDKSRVSDVREISGEGVEAKVDGRQVLVGNGRLMKRFGIEYIECRGTGTAVHVASDGEYIGHILVADVIKPTAKRAISELKKLGVKKTVMLTGDSEAVANAVGRELCADEVQAGLLPQDKVAVTEAYLQKAAKNEKVAFAGDGINDAPTLMRADVGIAMGALGSDAAIEAADVVLMDDDPLKISKAVRLAKRCMRIVYENLYFSIGVKLLCLILGATGAAGMWTAVFADVGVMMIAVLNGMRTMFVKNEVKK
ncbi:MAG: cadmium-translocating P-type ATPase [Clostridia bacterium]|nr:cadmium-translocating P-type ATPase [Clostridia bacterium]